MDPRENTLKYLNDKKVLQLFEVKLIKILKNS